ncbi:unnamed protein product [Onchocerca ochengi]|uniref:NADH dehydrogenase [ubiquinone] 1 alpha subcomplex subunit 2 n=1 Tax=Onchocerca ochengi TaxID=42157 RepID=A0A182ESR7_ONCOC|nr:unnamed protein product [Onchocerca ochengi]
MSSSGAAIKLGQGALRELRIHLCPTSAASAGVRNFIENDYVPLKKVNRHFPILIRECRGVQPKVYARYSCGIEKSIPLDNISRYKVLDIIKDLVTGKVS